MKTDSPPFTRRAPKQAVVQPITDLYEERARMAFKDTFLKLRKERGWTQQQVADQIGLSVGQVKKYEKGDSAPTLHILGRIAMVYGVSTDELVFEDGKGIAGVKLETELLQRFEKVAQLPKEEKDAVLLLIDSVVAKHTIREVMGS
jgi:transcriptional regulator with XRE-family HTH domain